MSSSNEEQISKEEGATVVVRVVKSFAYRNIKHMVFKDLDLDALTAQQLREMIDARIQSEGAFRAFRKATFDTLKINHQPGGFKDNNLAIALVEDEKHHVLDWDTSLADNGVVDETELSYYNDEDYASYVSNPEVKW